MRAESLADSSLLPSAEPIPGKAGSPSLSMSHNSAESEFAAANPDLPWKLTGSQMKTKRAIEINVDRMVSEAGIDRVGFLTLTVGDQGGDGFEQVWDSAEGSRRINNLARRFLPSIFERWIIVTERTKTKAIHFHLIVQTREAIREGFNWVNVRRGDYSSACPALRRIWAVLRAELPKHGFGRAQVEPLINAEAASRYVAKYVEKNLFNRMDADKGKKLVRYGGWNGSHCRSNDIGWATPKACEWRRKCARIAAIAKIETPAEARLALGGSWAWRMTKIMAAVARPNDPEFMADWSDAMQAEEADVWLATHIASNFRKVSEDLERATVLSASAAFAEAESLIADEGSDYFDPWRVSAA